MAKVQRSEHERKYDRQMRLWGGHGQKALEEATICVLGSSSVASEAMKNLVLPNIGTFTIIDDAKVTTRDCGNNFFVTQEDVGKDRATVVKDWLSEMNPDVKGTAILKSINDVVCGDLAYFDSFDVVIATNLYGDNHKKLGDYCYEKGILYINLRVNGMFGYLRVVYRQLEIMESHPTDDRTDFYMYPKQLENFKELVDFANSFDIRTQDIEKKAHLPCVALLIQYTREWLASHDGKLPGSFKEQQAFKAGLNAFGDDENIDDAKRWAFQCYNEPRVDRQVQIVLKDPRGDKIDGKSSQFWVLVRGLRDFMEKEGAGFLPVSTNIPDITADSKSYVTLKKIYKERAQRDLDLIGGYVKSRLKEAGRKEDEISDRVIERFVKNCRNLLVLNGKSVSDELEKPDKNHLEEEYEVPFDMSALSGGADEEKAPPKPFQPLMVHYYWMWRASDQFVNEFKRLPGEGKGAKRAEDTAALVKIQKAMLDGIKMGDKEVEEPVLSELARYGGCELHNTSAFMGGVCSQVVMKAVLKQFEALNHTFVYNGIYCESKRFRV